MPVSPSVHEVHLFDPITPLDDKQRSDFTRPLVRVSVLLSTLTVEESGCESEQSHFYLRSLYVIALIIQFYANDISEILNLLLSEPTSSVQRDIVEF